MSRSNVVSDGYALGFAIGADLARDRCRGQAAQAGGLPRRSGASARSRSTFCRSAMRAKPSRAKRAALTLPTPKMKLTGFGARKAGASAGAEHGKAARLVEIGRDLGEEFVAGQPDRDGDAELASRPRSAKRASTLAGREPCRRSVPDRSRNASSIDSGSTSGVKRQHHLPHLAADARIFLHVRPHDARVRAQPQRLEHRHGRAHAVGARDIAGRRRPRRAAAADDHRLGGKRRIVALFDGGVERVAVDMGDGELAEFVVAHKARRAAGAAARAIARRRRRGSRGRRRSRHVSAPMSRCRARCGRARRRPDRSRRSSANAIRRLSSPSICSSTPARKPGSRAAARIRAGFDTGHGEEARELFRLLGDERKRLNCQHFRRFPRSARWAFSCGSICLSVMISGLASNRDFGALAAGDFSWGR